MRSLPRRSVIARAVPRPSLVQSGSSSWRLFGAHSNSGVHAITAHDPRLVAGGRFTRMVSDSMGHIPDAVGAGFIAAWNGATWDSVRAGLGRLGSEVCTP